MKGWSNYYSQIHRFISDYRHEIQHLKLDLPLYCMALLAAVIVMGATKGLLLRCEITNSKMTAEIWQITHRAIANT